VGSDPDFIGAGEQSLEFIQAQGFLGAHLMVDAG
jgi:hypothetical protein